MVTPLETSLEIRPESRFKLIDVRRLVGNGHGDPLADYPRALYVSYHTTAGYVDPALSARLGHRRESVEAFFERIARIFPPDAGYQHDRMELRHELTDAERAVEPRNADSHLAFIGGGLASCVTWERKADRPVWFVDLDGVNGPVRRLRRTTVIGYHRDETVAELEMAIPVSSRSIDSVNLKDPALGFFDALRDLLDKHGIAKGRIDITLPESETQAGLTMNEYETLLMRHDLTEVLAHPLPHIAQKARNILQNPRAIPGKTISYARYDVVQVLNELMDVLGVRESVVERLVARMLAAPASRFLRLKRCISLPVFDRDTPGRGGILEGTYQSPILVQWNQATGGVRRVHVRLARLL